MIFFPFGFSWDSPKLVQWTGVYNCEEDIGTFTIKAVDDPRTLNKQLLIRPEPNIKSMNEVVQLWEKKIGHSLDKTYVPESEVLKQIEGKRKRRKSPLTRPFWKSPLLFVQHYMYVLYRVFDRIHVS
jgi:hypothetical protein